jgi:ankyrin repeat protein
MSKSADVGKKNIVGSTAIDLAMKTGRSDLVRLLTNRGSAVIANTLDTTKTRERNPDWGQAVTQGNLQKIKSLFAPGVDVNELGANGRTALMVAAAAGDAQAVSWLLANKANPNVPDYKQGRTALMIAAEAGHAEVVQILLNAGANPNAKDRLGETAMSNAQRLNRIQVGRVLKQAGVKTPSYTQILPEP